MSDVEFLILGGGATGLGSARRLLEYGVQSFLVLESRDRFGGLGGSVTDEAGYTWDFGCHAYHSHYAMFDRVLTDALGPEGWKWHTRRSWVRLDGAQVPYPFQNNIHRLPGHEAHRCLEQLRAAQRDRSSSSRAPRNFEEWITKTYGERICALFMRPYNVKVWGRPLISLDWKWVADRLSVPDAGRVERSDLDGRDDSSFGPNRVFRYPESGGSGAVWRVLAGQLPESAKRCSTPVERVDLGGHRVTTRSGESIGYRHLITTMPLDRFTDLTSRPDLVQAGRRLVHRALRLVGLGIREQPPTTLGGESWGYYPEPDVPFYRATICSNLSRANLPRSGAGWSLLLEVAENPDARVEGEALVRRVTRSAVEVGLVHDASLIHHVWSKRLGWGYPTPTLDRDAALATLLPALEQADVHSRGRFGAWKYEVGNQDHCFMQGVEVVDRLLGHVDPELGPEPTLNRSDTVNACYR